MSTPEERFYTRLKDMPRYYTTSQLALMKNMYLAACEEDARIAENYRDPVCVESISGKNIAKAIRGGSECK